MRVQLRLGNAYGGRAPATLYSEAFYADVQRQPKTRFRLPDQHEDRGIYVVAGSVTIAGQCFEASQMMVFRPGDAITVASGETGARLMILRMARAYHWQPGLTSL